MADIKSPRLLYLKAALFLSVGSLAAGLLLLENPTPRSAALLGVSIWAFARAYYFAFYVIEHYIDPGYKYAGLLSLLRYLARRGPDGRRSRTDPRAGRIRDADGS